MTRLGVVGNISRDTAEYPDGHRSQLLGGAALYITLAAARTGVAATPITVVGTDLADALRLPALQSLDLSGVAVVDRPSCRFHIRYDEQHTVIGIDADYGAAHLLTSHALVQASQYDFVHVCCRRPLDAVPVLTALIGRGQPFSVDFIAASAAAMGAATAHLLPRAQIIFTSIWEYGLLTQTVDAARLRAVTVTDGPRPVALYRYGRRVAEVAATQAEVVEVTGAGDTFTGTYLAAVLRGEPQVRALHHATRTATTRVTNPGISLHHTPP